MAGSHDGRRHAVALLRGAAVLAARELHGALDSDAARAVRRAAEARAPTLARALEPATAAVLAGVLRERAPELGRVLARETVETFLGAATTTAAGLGRALGSETARQARSAAISTLAQISVLADPETVAVLRQAALTPVDPGSLEGGDLELIRRLSEPVDALVRGYFRFEVEGVEAVPSGPALLVSNHDSGTTFVQVLGMGARFYLERGTDERIVGLMHDVLFRVPLLANVLVRLGAIRASHRSADAALARGFKVYVAPGGAREAFRPWTERHEIKFSGRRGWVRLALRNRVPIVPVVFIGGQETFFVLGDGEYLAENLGLKRRLRLDTFPLFLGLPWGVGLGPLFHLPLPAKCKVRFLEPVDPWSFEGGTEAEREAAVYDAVTAAMQRALDEMAAERRLPFVG